MTLDNIISIVRDILVIGYMFVLRIGVPLLLTLMIGAWLRRMLEDKTEETETETKTEVQPATAHVKTK